MTISHRMMAAGAPSSGSSGMSAPSASSGVRVVTPALALAVEQLLEDGGVKNYNERVVHMLVDIMQCKHTESFMWMSTVFTGTPRGGHILIACIR